MPDPTILAFIVRWQRYAAVKASGTEAPHLMREEWQLIANGLACYVNGLCPTLDQALGVGRERGERDLRNTARRRERDVLMHDLAESQWPGSATHRQTILLEALWRRFHTTHWQRDGHLDEPPPEYSTVLKQLFLLTKLNNGHMLTEHGIRPLLTWRKRC